MTDLPVPKYKLGDVVYRASQTSVAKQLLCPDCLGTKRWKIVTPGGTELEATCQRCDSSYQLRELPSLTYHAYEPLVETLTIGSVQINTAEYDGEFVKYMCRETGVGSGSVYPEKDFFDTLELAKHAAQARCDVLNAKKVEEPARVEARRFSALMLKDALIEHTWRARWHAWYSYRRLLEDVEDMIKDQPNSDLIEGLKSKISFKHSYRDAPALEQLRRAAEAGELTQVKDIIEEFYSATKQLNTKENVDG